MKKGFTLIELLAVILILGIIALIAIPTINNILTESRRGAFSSTLNNLEKAIEEKCTVEQIKNKEIITSYTIIDGNITPNVDIKGDLPDGKIYVNNNCEISYELSNKNFTGVKDFNNEIVITDGPIQKYSEALLNGTDPVLFHGLVPVIVENDGTVKKADIKNKWYSYEEKWWANAVKLTPSGKVEDDGTILESSIESYFVWIPRYKYKIFDMGNYTELISAQPTGSSVTTIDIIFENKYAPVSTAAEVGHYHSHPAFQAFNTNGFWMGKFETTGDVTNPTIKPNNEFLRNVDVKTMFETAYNYDRNNESHMMKNIEWGAVAYLSLSNYGINTRININNNSQYKTGYSSVVNINDENFQGTTGTSTSTTRLYNTETGYSATTTGNISGVYDMSGGALEYMASYKDTKFGTSGFDSNSISVYDKKYFDIYPSDGTATSYNNRILGDATGELGPFYYYSSYKVNNWWWKSSAELITSSNPWVIRSGNMNFGNFSGQLYFDAYPGGGYTTASFRIILSK